MRITTSRNGQRSLVSLLVALGLAGVADAREAHPPGAGMPHNIRYFEMVTSSGGAEGGGQYLTRRSSADRTQIDVSLRMLGRHFEIRLEPNDLLAPNAKNIWIHGSQVVEEEPQRALFKGRLTGEPDSWVRMSVRHGTLDGMIYTPDEIYFVEPASRFFDDVAGGEMVAYRLSDTDSEWLPGSCAALHVPEGDRADGDDVVRSRGGLASYKRLAAVLRVLAAAATLERADIGIVADYEFFERWGAGSATKMQDILNQVDGVYQAEVGVTLQVTKTVVHTSVNDPFSSTTNPSGLLYELSSYKNANDNSPSDPLYGTDLGHLFTGRNLDGSVIGIAWIGTVCSSYYGNGLSQDFTTINKSLVLLTAHEIGHNFSAPHDNQAGSACGYEPWGYIMNPSLGSSLSLQFSECSEDHIASEVAAASCLDTVTEGTVTPTPTPASTATPTPIPTSTATPFVVLDPIPSPIVVGGTVTLTGSGFTAGSIIKAFVATAAGPMDFGPYTPSIWTPTSLVWQVSASIPLGNGFATIVIVNTDQGYIESNPQGQLLYGAAGANIPTITGIDGVGINPADPAVPLANVDTVILQGSTVTITGSGFNSPLVGLFTATGNEGPLAPLGGGSSSAIQIVVPADAVTGPGSIQVVNSPYTGNVLSNAVSVPIGERIRVDGVSQAGATITVAGAGFSALTVISLFNQQGETVVNLGGLINGSESLIPLNVISSTEFTFQVPAGAVTGPAYVQALNPPFIPFTSSGNDPGGAFDLVVP